MKRAWINVGVAIGCVGLLTALVTCGILHLREKARSSQCRNNCEQLGLAIHNYYDAHRALPPAFWSSTGWGWRSLIQPYMESSSLYQFLDVTNGRLGDWEHNPRRGDFIRFPISSDNCPSDSPKLQLAAAIEPVFLYRFKGTETTWDISERLLVFEKTAIRTSKSGGRRPIALSNYITIFGDEDLICAKPGSGLFGPNSGTTWVDVKDGTSMTLMLAERDGSIHLAGNWAGTSYDENDPEACLDPQFVVDALVDSRPINGRDERCFSSRHPGGAHFLFADGAVKFINENCSTTILRRLANRADGIKVNETDIATGQ